MVVTADVELPTDEDLTVDELNLSTATLMAGANYVGTQCEAVNNEFMLCRTEHPADPRPCVELGKLVTECSRKAFLKIKNCCLHEFNQFANCIDKSSGDYRMWYCRKTQGVFNDCMRRSACYHAPHFGYFTRARIHKPDSELEPPPPPPCPCKPTVEDATPSLPDCRPRIPARFTGRLYWVTE